MMHLRYLVPFVLALSTISCQAEPDFSNPDAAFSTSLIEAKFALLSPTQLIFLLVADDANTPDAAELRGRLPQSIRSRLIHEVQAGWTSCDDGDPARWHPGDARVIVSRPSAPDAEALLTWVDVPDLAWITNTSKEEEIEPIVAATTAALGARLAKPEESFRPLRATRRSIDLIAGTRAPENAAEAEFIATLPKWFELKVIVANTRDDEDVSLIEDLIPIETWNEQLLYSEISVIGPSTFGDASCHVWPLRDSRLERWTDQMNARFIAWPCTKQDTWDDLMGGWFNDCGNRCYGHAPIISPDGVAQCRAFIDQPDLSACDPTRGWSDPEESATFVTRWGTKLRHCEIAQHTGEKLDACRHSLECPDCGGGFCMSELPGLVEPESWCPGSDVSWPLRFTGGSIAAPGGLLRVVCDTGVH